MGVWVNWGLVFGAIAFIVGDLVLEVYETVNLAALGMCLLAGGILGLAIDSAAVGLGTAIVLVLVYLVVHRRPGHMLPKHVSAACVPGGDGPPSKRALKQLQFPDRRQPSRWPVQEFRLPIGTC